MPSSPPFTRVSKTVLVGAVFLVALILGRHFYFPYTKEGRREACIEAARLHAKNIVAPLLAKDKRFADIRATEWWKDEGYFWVRGDVETEAELRDLKQLIISTHPPAPIAWDVKVAAVPNTKTNTP